MVVQESVVESPAVIGVGVAESEQVGRGGGVTVTVVAQVTEPPGPVAVPVYVVLSTGETLVEPLVTGV